MKWQSYHRIVVLEDHLLHYRHSGPQTSECAPPMKRSIPFPATGLSTLVSIVGMIFLVLSRKVGPGGNQPLIKVSSASFMQLSHNLCLSTPWTCWE